MATTILRDIESRIAYAKALNDDVLECQLCSEAWDEAMEALEPYMVLRYGCNPRYHGVDLVRNDSVSWVELKTRDTEAE